MLNQVQELTAQEPALILFSGDAFNPSLLSTVTKVRWLLAQPETCINLSWSFLVSYARCAALQQHTGMAACLPVCMCCIAGQAAPFHVHVVPAGTTPCGMQCTVLGQVLCCQTSLGAAAPALQGCHMVPVLNALGVHCAAVGNHDVDWGIPKLEELIGACHFPWLLANVLDRFAEGVPSHQRVVQHVGHVHMHAGVSGC